MATGRVVVLKPYGFLAVEEVELPEPADRQVAVELLAAAIGPEQIALVQAADEPHWRPAVPGDAAVGRVLAAGAAVTRAAVGDLVLIGAAAEAEGEPQVAAITFLDGSVQDDRAVWTWATNVVVDERFVTMVPAELAQHGEALAALDDLADATSLADKVGRRYTIEEINEAVLDAESNPPDRTPLLILEPLR